jgi:AcrR family transcriptional regulator
MAMPADVSRKLRADAQENRDRVLAAARALFAEVGLDVGMREVARRAGVGPATLYRRFPTRQDLVDAAFAVELDTCSAIVEEGCADIDAWRGFTTAVERLLVHAVQNRGFVDAFTATAPVPATFAAHRRRLLGMLEGLARRAQHEGRLRPDFVVGDLVIVLLAGRGLATGPGREAAARRFAALAIDAFRAPSPASTGT